MPAFKVCAAAVRAEAVQRVVVVGAGMAAVRLVEGLVGVRPRPSRWSATSTPPALQPDPALGRARGHPRRRGAQPALRAVVRRPRRRPAPRLPGARRRPRAPRGRCSSTADRCPTTGWSWPPAASRRCRRSAGSCRSTAGCTSACTPSATSTTARRLLAALPGADRAVVVGGGLLGLQVARALSVRGVATEVVEGGEHLLRSQVGTQAGRILARDLRRLGTEVYTGARAVRLTDGPAASASTTATRCRPTSS